MNEWLRQVRLEVGERRQEDGQVQTQTALFDIQINPQGIITKIKATTKESHRQPGKDLAGKLALPAFKEMHNHLDKTYLGRPWKAAVPVKTLQERLSLEAQELVALSSDVTQRATKMIELHLKNGVNHIRSHVNIDSYIGLENLHGVKQALESFSKDLTYEIVAFPQHGLLKEPKTLELLEEALQSGATILGGLDPAGIDQAIEASLDQTLQLAQKYQVAVDFHLHDRGQVGLYTMQQWLRRTKQSNYQGQTTFSHAFALSHLSSGQQAQVIQELAENKIQVTSTIPLNLKSALIPIDALQAQGVKVALGCDGFYDSWSPNFSGDILEKLRNFCEYTGKSSEQALRQSLGLITNQVTPLNSQGQQVWPKVGDEASFVFFQASCSAEVIARVPKVRQMMHQGRWVNRS